MTQPFTDADIALLGRAARAVIPPSEAHGAPGADDPDILSEIAKGAAARTEAVRAALAAFADTEDPLLFPQTNPEEATLLQTLVVTAYYRDPRVLRSLGREVRPPFPQGYELDSGDLSALDKVRARGAIWRRAI